MMHRLYARVSTTDQTCESQLQALRADCESRGWTERTEYVDAGVSGTRRERPELTRLLKEVRRGDTVVCFKLDRFGRSVSHLKTLLDDLESRGVRFIVPGQGLDTASGNATGRLLLNVLAALAEFEHDLIQDRVITGIRRAQKAGTHCGRPARVFRRDVAGELRAAGKSWTAIAAELKVPVSTIRDGLRKVSAGK